jgi:hypothetical protein
MSVKSQQNNMKAIFDLVSQDLTYIHGENENGMNGVKKQFHTKSSAFLRALGKDLGFTNMNVTSNPGGIAVSGEISLMGMWSEGNGLFMQIYKSFTHLEEFMYRSITSMRDYIGGVNQWLPYSVFKQGDYERLIRILLKVREMSEALYHVA